MYSQAIELLISIDLPRMTEDFRRSCGAIFHLGWKRLIYMYILESVEPWWEATKTLISLQLMIPTKKVA